MRNVYNRCQRVYVPSQIILEELRRHALRNLVHPPHGVDTLTFNPAHRDPLWKEWLGASGKYVLLYVRRLAWEKGLRLLAEAYRMLMTKREDVLFLLVGEGPARSGLQQLMPRAVFLGHLSGTELAGHLPRAISLFSRPSKRSAM